MHFVSTVCVVRTVRTVHNQNSKKNRSRSFCSISAVI